MAVAMVVDPEWQYQVNQVGRILEKNGATDIAVYKHVPAYPQGFIISYRVGNYLRQAAGENLAKLTETIVKQLTEEVL